MVPSGKITHGQGDVALNHLQFGVVTKKQTVSMVQSFFSLGF